MSDNEIILFEHADAFEQWLNEHHDTSSGLWLKIAKKRSNKTSISITEALDIVLYFGWIDSQRRKLDDDFYLQRYSPRRKKSNWSRINIEKAKTLIRIGKMGEAGFKEIKAAIADGRWDVASLKISN